MKKYIVSVDGEIYTHFNSHLFTIEKVHAILAADPRTAGKAYTIVEEEEQLDYKLKRYGDIKWPTKLVECLVLSSYKNWVKIIQKHPNWSVSMRLWLPTFFSMAVHKT